MSELNHSIPGDFAYVTAREVEVITEVVILGYSDSRLVAG